jgi:hypothetical protein
MSKFNLSAMVHIALTPEQSGHLENLLWECSVETDDGTSFLREDAETTAIWRVVKAANEGMLQNRLRAYGDGSADKLMRSDALLAANLLDIARQEINNREHGAAMQQCEDRTPLPRD